MATNHAFETRLRYIEPAEKFDVYRVKSETEIADVLFQLHDIWHHEITPLLLKMCSSDDKKAECIRIPFEKDFTICPANMVSQYDRNRFSNQYGTVTVKKSVETKVIDIFRKHGLIVHIKLTLPQDDILNRFRNNTTFGSNIRRKVILTCLGKGTSDSLFEMASVVGGSENDGMINNIFTKKDLQGNLSLTGLSVVANYKDRYFVSERSNHCEILDNRYWYNDNEDDKLYLADVKNSNLADSDFSFNHIGALSIEAASHAIYTERLTDDSDVVAHAVRLRHTHVNGPDNVDPLKGKIGQYLKVRDVMTSMISSTHFPHIDSRDILDSYPRRRDTFSDTQGASIRNIICVSADDDRLFRESDEYEFLFSLSKNELFSNAKELDIEKTDSKKLNYISADMQGELKACITSMIKSLKLNRKNIVKKLTYKFILEKYRSDTPHTVVENTYREHVADIVQKPAFKDMFYLGDVVKQIHDKKTYMASLRPRSSKSKMVYTCQRAAKSKNKPTLSLCTMAINHQNNNPSAVQILSDVDDTVDALVKFKTLLEKESFTMAEMLDAGIHIKDTNLFIDGLILGKPNFINIEWLPDQEHIDDASHPYAYTRYITDKHAYSKVVKYLLHGKFKFVTLYPEQDSERINQFMESCNTLGIAMCD